MVTPLILDCDPGHDDALAILLAVADPAVDLLAVTTVAGNQTVDKCTVNARRVLSLAGVSEVPVARGAEETRSRPSLHLAARTATTSTTSRIPTR